MTRAITRGERNRNPGNIRKSKDPWQGLADQQPDPEFFTFKGPEWGIRALARVLIRYQDDHGLNTVRAIINRWAPPVENDTGAYVRAVAKAMGVSADEPIDVQQYDTMRPLAAAIISHECAGLKYPDAVLDKGLALAGIVPSGKTVVVKKPQPPASMDMGVLTTTAGSVAGAIVASKVVVDAVNEINAATAPTFGEYAPIIGAVVMLGAFAVIGYRVWQRRKAEA